MREEMVFAFGMPPSVNKLYRRIRGGQLALTDVAFAYREHIKETVMDSLHELNDFPIDEETVYGLRITMIFKTLQNPGWFKRFTRGKRKGERKAKSRYKKVDVDNRIKFLQDCLVKTVGIPDDAQVFVGHQRKIEGDEESAHVILYVSDPQLFLREDQWEK